MSELKWRLYRFVVFVERGELSVSHAEYRHFNHIYMHIALRVCERGVPLGDNSVPVDPEVP
jgi:hypothetical protein